MTGAPDLKFFKFLSDLACLSSSIPAERLRLELSDLELFVMQDAYFLVT